VLVTSQLLGLVTMATIVGNVFVMVAILVERHLRVNVANYLIVSLAVADLLVAALVMPLAAVNDVTRSIQLTPQGTTPSPNSTLATLAPTLSTLSPR